MTDQPAHHCPTCGAREWLQGALVCPDAWHDAAARYSPVDGARVPDEVQLAGGDRNVVRGNTFPPAAIAFVPEVKLDPARDLTPVVDDPFVAVLIAHQRAASDACLCGPLPLGSSHAQHVADLAAPVIERWVRAQIAADIEAKRDRLAEVGAYGPPLWVAGMNEAAKIARGES